MLRMHRCLLEIKSGLAASAKYQKDRNIERCIRSKCVDVLKIKQVRHDDIGPTMTPTSPASCDADWPISSIAVDDTTLVDGGHRSRS